MKKKKEKEKEISKYSKDYSQTTLETSSEEVAEKLSKGCECAVSCFQGLDPETVYRHRLSIAELTKNEQDFYLMGIVRAALVDPNDRGDKRQRKRSNYSHLGKKVCLFAFLYLENVTVYHLKKVRTHVLKNGVVSIEHGNSHKIPHNAFPLDIYKTVDNFLRGHLNIDKSSNKTVTLTQPLSKIYQEYKENFKDSIQIMGYTTFRTFFRKRFPNVRLSNQQPVKSTSTTITSQHHRFELIESKRDEEDICTNTNDLVYYDEEEIEIPEDEISEDLEIESVEIIGTTTKS
jgi:hypothetical protein